MPPRDPRTTQADFPQLVADLIDDLRLTGQVGVLDFTPTITPVFIVGSRGLSLDAAPPVFTSAQIFQGFASAAAVNTIVVDTGQLPAGTYDVFGEINMIGQSSVNCHIELQLRNAANAATLAVLADCAVVGATHPNRSRLPMMGLVIAEDERLRVQLVVSNNTGGVTGVIGARIRPVP